MAAVADHIDRHAWLEERRSGIGGSDVAALFGLHPFKTARDVYFEKVNPPGEDNPTPAMERGRVLEPVAAQLYTARTGRKVRRQPLRRHPEYPFLLASIDRQILSDGERPTGALEIKCPGLQVFWQMKRQGLRDYMILQGQHEALVWGYPFTAFALFNAEEWKLLDFDVPADEGVSQRIIETAGEFWEKHVLKGIPPEETTPRAELELPKVDGDVRRRQDPEFLEAMRAYVEAQELEKEASAIKDDAKARVKGILGELGTYEGGGFRVYYAAQAGRKSFQKKELERARPLDRDLVKEALLEAGLPAVDGILESCALELDQFEKQGNAFETFRFYRTRDEEV